MKAKVKEIRRWSRATIDEFHRNLGKYMVTTFDVVLVPKLKVKQLACRATRVIPIESVRDLYRWGHHRFYSFLATKARQHGKIVMWSDEPFTTQTCQRCGTRNLRVGASETFECVNKECGYVTGRDANASQGVGSRAFVTDGRFAYDSRIKTRKIGVKKIIKKLFGLNK